MGFQISFQNTNLVSLGIYSRSRIAGSYSSSIFNFLRILHTVFHSGCTNIHSDQQSRSVLISPYPHQYLLSPIFLIITILTGFYFHPLMISDIEHLFNTSAICMSSLGKYLFRSAAQFLICLFFYY